MNGSTGKRMYPKVKTGGIDGVAKSKMKVFVGTFVEPLVMSILRASVTVGKVSTISFSVAFRRSGDLITPLDVFSFLWGEMVTG
ncbi:hypothetical protein BOW30_12795, partial [Solemya velum gill symbiont]|uniref:hypothetical protein n=1 Tax=Solemya velum gill symbiont TaxID=2340 RepID=UPI0009CED7F0